MSDPRNMPPPAVPAAAPKVRYAVVNPFVWDNQNLAPGADVWMTEAEAKAHPGAVVVWTEQPHRTNASE